MLGRLDTNGKKMGCTYSSKTRRLLLSRRSMGYASPAEVIMPIMVS
jgi:hypothetical protein